MNSNNKINSQVVTKKYTVKLKDFEGPLDLLLHLIKTSEVNIYDISISEITEQYLEYLKLLVHLDIENISEFVEMASTLILIKSKTLLPIEVEYEEEEIETKEKLIQKLLEYQKYKFVAGILEMKAEESIIIPKRDDSKMLFDLQKENDLNWKSLSIIDLIGAFVKVLNSKENETSYELSLFEFSVEDKINSIKELLTYKERFNFFEIINEEMPKIEIICIFLAILELVKQEVIVIQQHKIFGDITIVRKYNSN